MPFERELELHLQPQRVASFKSPLPLRGTLAIKNDDKRMLYVWSNVDERAAASETGSAVHKVNGIGLDEKSGFIGLCVFIFDDSTMLNESCSP